MSCSSPTMKASVTPLSPEKPPYFSGTAPLLTVCFQAKFPLIYKCPLHEQRTTAGGDSQREWRPRMCLELKTFLCVFRRDWNINDASDLQPPPSPQGGNYPCRRNSAWVVGETRKEIPFSEVLAHVHREASASDTKNKRTIKTLEFILAEMVALCLLPQPSPSCLSLLYPVCNIHYPTVNFYGPTLLKSTFK